MGLFSSLFGRIGIQQPVVARPNMRELLYPGDLPLFNELAEKDHADPRALVYEYDDLNAERKKMPFTIDNLYSKGDFESEKEVYNALLKAGLIQELDKTEELADKFTQDELKEKLKEMGLKTGGKKIEQAQRLLDNGYRSTRSRKKRFTFTEKGINLYRQKKRDRQQTIIKAVGGLKTLSYNIAVKAYRDYDSKWGFAHTTEKKHTIFAHYDIPYSRFRFFEIYPMKEVLNSDDFKQTLRAVLMAGLMRGCQEEWELTMDFEYITKEPLKCPKLLSMFSGYSEAVLANMRDQMDGNAQAALTYYISHLEYLNRQQKTF